jgi:hypothetical protein
MARQTRRTRPGDAANLVVRCLLADAGNILGGLTEAQWQATLGYFGQNCAYTNKPLSGEIIVKDHAIPINKEHCGLHLYGNVLPCTREANAAKSDRHYREFVIDPIQLQRIEAFIEGSGYTKLVEAVGNLRGFCAHQYEVITGLCARNRDYVQRLIGPTSEELLVGTEDGSESYLVRRVRSKRQIVLDPSPAAVFKKLLLQLRRAWITVYYLDGKQETKPWIAERFSANSNVFGNLRSRPEFRNGAWERDGIARVVVSIEKPDECIPAKSKQK